MVDKKNRKPNQSLSTQSLDESNKVSDGQKSRKSKEKKAESKQPQTSQELCEKLHDLSQIKEWSKILVDEFVQLIVNPINKFSVSQEQTQELMESILRIPENYRSLVCLQILFRDYLQEKKSNNLEHIKDSLLEFIKKNLSLEPRVEDALLSTRGNKILFDSLKQKLKELKNSSEKLNFIRNTVSCLIGLGETHVIDYRIDIILDVLSSPTPSFQNIAFYENTAILANKRLRVVVDLFSLDKLTVKDAERLVMFGTFSHKIANKKQREILEACEILKRKERVINEQENLIRELEFQKKALNKEIENLKEELRLISAKLQQELSLYGQLKDSSSAKISQQRNSAISQMRKRIEHDLTKLERCFQGDLTSFNENIQIGLEIIGDIKDRLAE